MSKNFWRGRSVGTKRFRYRRPRSLLDVVVQYIESSGRGARPMWKVHTKYLNTSSPVTWMWFVCGLFAAYLFVSSTMCSRIRSSKSNRNASNAFNSVSDGKFVGPQPSKSSAMVCFARNTPGDQGSGVTFGCWFAQTSRGHLFEEKPSQNLRTLVPFSGCSGYSVRLHTHMPRCNVVFV